MNYKNMKNELIKKNGNRCSICGKEFSESNMPVIDHIIPFSAGGTSSIENLQLTCNTCNIKKANKLIYTEVFEGYIRSIVEMSNKYDIISTNVPYDNGVDLILKDKEKQHYKICSICTNTAFTTDRLDNISDELKKCAEKFNKKYHNINCVFIFPGKLSTRDYLKLDLKRIEIWDKDYLITEFKNEILKLNSPYLNSILKIFENKPKEVVNQYMQKIQQLKECKPGVESWNKYQKLIGEILEILFCPQLNKPIEEVYDGNKRNRRDFIIPNYATDGFWKFMMERYNADFIVVDAKNSAKGVRKQDILQISNYLKKSGTGLFAIIIARKFNMKLLLDVLKEKWQFEDKMILILDDNNIEQMLIEKMEDRDPEIIIRQKIEEFRLLI